MWRAGATFPGKVIVKVCVDILCWKCSADRPRLVLWMTPKSSTISRRMLNCTRPLGRSGCLLRRVLRRRTACRKQRIYSVRVSCVTCSLGERTGGGSDVASQRIYSESELSGSFNLSFINCNLLAVITKRSGGV